MQNYHISIIGAGLMGVGIAVHFARFNHNILLYDTISSRIDELSGVAEAILDELILAKCFPVEDKHKVLALLKGSTNIKDSTNSTLFIEAIPEKLTLKQALYEELEAFISPQAVIASNTSGLLPDALSSKMKHKERFLIAHFWHPPHFIPLVELVPGSATDTKILDDLQQFMLTTQLEAVKLNYAAPGFIGNRLQFALLREALHIIKSGIASAEVIDLVMRSSLGRRYAMVGPLEAADMTGLNTVQDILSHLLPELASGSNVLSVIEEKVAKNEVGVRSGRGFYHWDETKKQSIQKKREHQLKFALKP